MVSCSSSDKRPPQNEFVKAIANKCFDLVIIELDKPEMKQHIQDKIITPLMNMIYHQLYPYIYTFAIAFLLMFLMLIFILVAFIIYLKK